LDLTGVSLQDEVAVRAVEALLLRNKGNPLRSLILGQNRLSREGRDLLGLALAASPSIESLTCVGDVLSWEALGVVLTSHTPSRLTSLELQGQGRMASSGEFKALFDGLAASQSLRTLRLLGVSFGDVGMPPLLDLLKQQRSGQAAYMCELVLHNNGVGSVGAESLGPALSESTVSTLSLRGNPIGSGCNSFAGALATAPCLTSLDLASTGLTGREAGALARALGKARAPQPDTPGPERKQAGRHRRGGPSRHVEQEYHTGVAGSA
jgi:hypothetical protein